MRGGPGTTDPGRFIWGAVTLKQLLIRAWEIDSARLVGPDWLDRQTLYRLEATMPASATRAQFEKMLQNLLTERFQLKLRHETRMYPGYDLVVAPGGPKLTLAVDHSDWPPLSAGAVDSKGCPILRNGRHEFTAISRSGAVCITYEGVSLDEFSKSASLLGYVHLPDGSIGHIVDKTGLKGNYDFKLIFDGATGAHAPIVGARVGEAPTQDEVGSGLPNIFTATERQLGLRLQKVNAIALDTLVIEGGNPIPLDN